MTPQEAKDQIAVKYGYSTWRRLVMDNINADLYFIVSQYENEAMELYARAKCEEHKKPNYDAANRFIQSMMDKGYNLNSQEQNDITDLYINHFISEY